MKRIEQKEQSAERCKISVGKGSWREVVCPKIGRKNEKKGREREISKVGTAAVVGKAGSACRK